MIYDSVIAMASGKTAITNLIGSSPMRLFPILLPQGISTFPSMAFNTVDNLGNPTFDGASTFDQLHVDFHVYADTIKDVDDVVDTFRTEMEDTTGTFAGTEITGVRFVNSGADDWLEDMDKKTRQFELRFSYKR